MLWLIASIKFLVPLYLFFALGAQLGSRLGSPEPAANYALDRVGMSMDSLSLPVAKPAISGYLPQGHSPSASGIGAILLLAVWLGGCATVGALQWRRWRRVCAIVRGASPLLLQIDGRGIEVRTSSEMVEPAAFGIWRPVLLLPAGIAERLSPAQMQAILAHEMCHVRRRDNLAAAIHMVVEAIFWFHPLVWWLGARLVEERERACDEEVVQLGSQPLDYAEGILRVCRFYLESPSCCASGITGSDLKQRVERIMDGRAARGARRLSFGKKLLLAAAGFAAVSQPIVTGWARAPRVQLLAQSADAPSYEVASIKPSPANARGGSIRPTPDGGITAENVSLKVLIRTAYRIQDYQIAGGPNWLDVDPYDIQAKRPGKGGSDGGRLALRKLLADRFHLTVHTETKDLPVYALVVAKNGPKFQEAKRAPQEDDGGWRMGRGYMHGQMVPFAELSELLSGQLGRPVLDQTGIRGIYDLKLDWTPTGYVPREGGASNEPRPDPDGPTIFTAIQEQLGLRLESRKGPVEILVIDRAEKPTEN
jgi:bla regulator protein blaR1